MRGSGRLQDIDAWIKLVSAENKKGFWGIFNKITNRFAVPFMMFKSTNEWLELLKFDRKQELERIRFMHDTSCKK